MPKKVLKLHMMTLTYYRLATNSEFRDLARNAMTEMQKAGIDIKAEVRCLAGNLA